MQTRLNININTITVNAIESVSDKHQVSKTEAVRRLIGVGWYVAEQLREGKTMYFKKNGELEKVIFDVEL